MQIQYLHTLCSFYSFLLISSIFQICGQEKLCPEENIVKLSPCVILSCFCCFNSGVFSFWFWVQMYVFDACSLIMWWFWNWKCHFLSFNTINSILDSISAFLLLFIFFQLICSIKHEMTWLLSAPAAAKSLQSCLTLCDPIDGSPPGSPVPGILQARTLEWVAISFSNVWKWKVKVKLLSRVRLWATPWTAAYQAPPSMGFSRQEYWSGVPLPSPWLLSRKHKLWQDMPDVSRSTYTRVGRKFDDICMKGYGWIPWDVSLVNIRMEITGIEMDFVATQNERLTVMRTHWLVTVFWT